MKNFTALIVYLALFLIVPYVTTIVYLRWKRIHIRFARQASIGMEIACFLPMILATHVLAVKITPLVDQGIVWIGDLIKRDWVGAFSGRSYVDTFVYLFKVDNINTIGQIEPWLDLFGLVFVVHFIATMILAWEIIREINWATELQIKKAKPDTTPLTSTQDTTEDKSDPEKPFLLLNVLEWLRSFGIWNELSQDLSFQDAITSRKVRLDACLDSGGEVIYQGTLEAYSDSGGFNGIVMRDVQVKRNAPMKAIENIDQDTPPTGLFKMLLQYPSKPELGGQRKLDRLFIPISDIKTLHRRLNISGEVAADKIGIARDSGKEALNVNGNEAAQLSKSMGNGSVFNIEYKENSTKQQKTDHKDPKPESH